MAGTDGINLQLRVQKAKEDLDKYGVAVVPDVLTEAECDGYIKEYHQWLDTFGEDFPIHKESIIHKYRIAHLPENWDIRLKMKATFEELWGTTKLLSSIDGMAFGEPPEKGRNKFETPGKYALHFDQGQGRVGLHAYQGAVYVEEQTETDWCFMVIEGSHKFHTEFYQTFKESPHSEFRLLKKKEIAWLEEKGCKIKKIPAPKGSIVLWDSRTVHSGVNPKEGRENAGRWRYVVFISMTPAAWASERDFKVKKDGYLNMGCSRHWSSDGYSNFQVEPTPDMDCVQELPPIATTDEAKQLMGTLPYNFSDGAPNGPEKPIWKTGGDFFDPRTIEA